MKNPIHLIIFLFCTATAYAQPGGWSIAMESCQFSMTMVAQIQVNGVPDHLLNNHVAVYSRGQIRGYATPVQISGQAFYFLSLCSDAYKGDTLYFRAYLGAENKIYESVDTIVFKHHLALGRIADPFPIRFVQGDRPLIYSLAAVHYAAGTCNDVLDVQTSDKQNSEGSGLTYSIVGGADASRFSINPVTGVLSWNNFVPDVANPADNDMDNHYEVDVKVADASNLSDLQRITVTVVKNAALPPLVCPPNQTYLTNSNGTGDCGAEANRTGVALPNLCALYDLTYQLTGATTGSGSGQIPQIQSFTKAPPRRPTRWADQAPAPVRLPLWFPTTSRPRRCCPNSVTVSCTSGFPAANSNLVTGSDNCISFSKNHVGDALPSDYSSPNRYNVVRTYRITDAVGNNTTARKPSRYTIPHCRCSPLYPPT
ncbi:MAG: cadherin repeat domain-containing protein [Lewinellaceae bacterium]|nr:cadherin repeat domain-containing protein [Lewinellaceae bacterium]